MTTTVTPEYIKEIRPEFESTDDVKLLRFINKAVREMNEAAWGELYNEGVENLTLHLLTMDARASNAANGTDQAAGGGAIVGALKWEQVGVLQKGYADARAGSNVGAVAGSNAWFEATTWGSRYAYLMSLIFADRVGDDAIFIGVL